MAPALTQPVTGLTPPSFAEARIRETYPSVARSSACAALGQRLIGTIVLAPLGWLVMAWPYFSKVLPFLMCRYVLTNRRVMVRRGWNGAVTHEVPLSQIDDVVMPKESISEFFRSGDLQIKTGDKVVLTLEAVPDPESFRLTILNSRDAWVPGKAKLMPFISASAK